MDGRMYDVQSSGRGQLAGLAVAAKIACGSDELRIQDSRHTGQRVDDRGLRVTDGT
jgi:hypothetical protein